MGIKFTTDKPYLHPITRAPSHYLNIDYAKSSIKGVDTYSIYVVSFYNEAVRAESIEAGVEAFVEHGIVLDKKYEDTSGITLKDCDKQSLYNWLYAEHPEIVKDGEKV